MTHRHTALRAFPRQSPQSRNIILHTPRAVTGLKDHISGDVITPDHPEYDARRAVWNAMHDRHPAAVIRCLDTADVVRVVRHAARTGLPLAVRGGGHSVAGHSTCDGGLVCDLGAMNHVNVDARARTARVGGGALWRDVDTATQRHSLAVPGGVVSHTGVAGLTLGGGIGNLSRQYGLTCDNLISAEIVTADGRVLDVDDTSDPELMWGLRGGGGNFGVVTRFDFRLHAVGPDVLSGVLFFPGDRLSELLPTYEKTAHRLPETATMVLSLFSDPQGTLVVGVAFFSTDLDEAPLGLLRGGPVPPFADTVTQRSYVDSQAMADVFWPRGDHDYFSGCHLSTLDDPALAAALGAAHARMPGPLCHLQLHHLGGAVARDPETSAFAGRGAPWMFTAAARWPDVAHTGPHLEWARSARAAVEPWATGRTYVNFLPESGHAEAAYDTDRLRRLTALKDRLDPANLFRLNQNIRPTEQQSGG